MDDVEVAELISKDEMDILVDLAGHTGYNRMLLFARRPAPVQVSWLGYPNTTGLPTIGYRIVDGYSDPPGLTEPFCTEKLIRMPESFLCYRPDKDSPAAGELPASKSGRVTFGSFNVLPKVSGKTFALWAALLRAIPESNLIMKTRSFFLTGPPATSRWKCLRHMVSLLRGLNWYDKPSFKEHLEMYNQIDVALDTFPYNGTTTTFEAIWMGIPVITLAGDTHASRVGASILSNIGLPELIARSRMNMLPSL